MTVIRDPGGVGDALREARERRGLSLRQIAATTKISARVLEALERNDISLLPGGIFGRAFVRAYAVEVGLDPEEIIKAFIVQFPIESVTVGHPATRPVEDKEAADSQERVTWTFWGLVLVSVPVAGLVMYLGGLARTGDDGAEPLTQYGLAAAPAPPPPEQPVAPVSSVVQSAQRPLLVSLAASGPCWVSVTVDGQVVLERELRAGDREMFEVDQAFAITAGSAGALALVFDGREIQPLGRIGQVVSRSFSRSNFEEFVVDP